MINTAQIFEDFKTSNGELFSVIEEFPEEKFNLRKTETSWSAGDICEHLLILDKYISGFLKGKKRPAERDPEEKIERIKSVFLDFSTKLHAPEPIAPKKEAKDKTAILSGLKNTRENLLKLTESDDLDQICLDFPHARLGELTGIEWLYFIIYHSKRHLKQIKDLY